jgi:hypothetical protein
VVFPAPGEAVSTVTGASVSVRSISGTAASMGSAGYGGLNLCNASGRMLPLYATFFHQASAVAVCAGRGTRATLLILHYANGMFHNVHCRGQLWGKRDRWGC